MTNTASLLQGSGWHIIAIFSKENGYYYCFHDSIQPYSFSEYSNTPYRILSWK